MVDAYKCQSCGEVVERPQNCPSCGEKGMRPTRVPESELDDEDGPASREPTDGELVRDSTAPSNPDDAATTADSRSGAHNDQPEGDGGRGDRREQTRENGRGGLLAWLRSLF